MTASAAYKKNMFGCSSVRIIPVIDAAVLVVSICDVLLRVSMRAA